VEVHLRFLVALPLLLAAEVIVHRRMSPLVGQFHARDLIPENARKEFESAVGSALRLRNSVLAELLILAFVYGVGVLFVWRWYASLEVSSWYGVRVEGSLSPSWAGWWFGCVSLPLFQFLLLRWYFRVFLWARLLVQVSRIELRVEPAHPDRAGGLGFIGIVGSAFMPLLFAQGVMVAGMMANRILFAGSTLLDFKAEIFGVAAVALIVVLGPMLAFMPRLARAKRAGAFGYGVLAQRYAREFDQKWLRGGAPSGEPLMGSADIQSLADLANSYEVVDKMRFVPFTLQNMLQLAVAPLLPIAPLALTMVSPAELLERVLKIVF